MRVIEANKFNFLKGGADKYYLDLADALARREGVEIARFTMEHPNNIFDRNAGYFVSFVDYNDFQWKDLFKYASRIIWSWEAARKFRRLAREFRPDILHVHNIYHQISPSILPAAKRMGIKVVMHLHDYKVLCPNVRMHNAQGICERCRGGKYYNCVRFRCIKNSRLKSFLGMIGMYLHHRVMRVYEKNVDLFIAPSQFMKKKAVEWGMDGRRIVVQPYFIDESSFRPEFSQGEYFLFYGRLEKEKGVMTLLNAIEKLPPDIRLKIVGVGEEYNRIKERIRASGLAGRVELAGFKYGEELKDIIRGSRAVIVPSEWYEVTGIVNLEAEVLGKPVIAAHIGGINEVIKNKETGFLFQSGNADDLAQKMQLLWQDPELAIKMGQSARKFTLKWFNKKNHIDNIINIYREVLKNK